MRYQKGEAVASLALSVEETAACKSLNPNGGRLFSANAVNETRAEIMTGRDFEANSSWKTACPLIGRDNRQVCAETRPRFPTYPARFHPALSVDSNAVGTLCCQAVP